MLTRKVKVFFIFINKSVDCTMCPAKNKAAFRRFFLWHSRPLMRTHERWFVTNCLWSGQRDWLDFLLKNLRRCIGFIWRYSRLAKPPCQTRSLACLQLIACNLQTKKATFSGDFFLFVVVLTRYN